MTFSGLPPKIVSCGEKKFDNWNDKEICQFMDDPIKNETCTPSVKYDFKSINVDFKIYCKDKIHIKNAISIETVGIILGSIFGGIYSDRNGRRKAIMYGILGSSFFGFMCSLSYAFLHIVVYRSLIGFCNGITLAVLPVYMIEMIGKKDRVWIMNVITWAPTAVMFSIIAYFAQDWKTLARVSAFLALPALFLIWYVEESPRWLIQHKKVDEAFLSLKRICTINKKFEDNEDIIRDALNEEMKRLDEQFSRNKNYSFRHLYYTWDFVKYSLALIALFFTASFSKYGIVYNMEQVYGSPYLNVILIGLSRYVMNLTVAFCDKKFKNLGRKHILTSFILGIAVAASIIGTLISYKVEEYFSEMIRVLQISIVGFTSQFYVIGAICSAELFPTPIRNMANGQLQFFSRIGTVLSPYMFYLTVYDDSAPYFVLLVLTFTTVISFYFFIPETKGKPLREGMPSKLEKIGYNKLADTEIESTEKSNELIN
uniref:MFS domain-containing protein n=1 Tax=Parastrongyloides trichosuri TaxID=131310 RepID=A0A0N4ZJY7_PARTI